MKSPMVSNAPYIADADKGNYTEMQVLHSPAGYYIGTMYNNTNPDGSIAFQEPGSRDSDYFRTEEAAQKYLDQINLLNQKDASDMLREHP